MLKSVIIGYGGIAKGAPVPAYKKLKEKGKVQLVAAFDIDPEAFKKKKLN